jgi:hypothetical protein
MLLTSDLNSFGRDCAHAPLYATCNYVKTLFFFIKNEYYFVSNPSNYTVKSNFLFRQGPFAFLGKGGGGGWVV